MQPAPHSCNLGHRFRCSLMSLKAGLPDTFASAMPRPEDALPLNRSHLQRISAGLSLQSGL